MELIPILSEAGLREVEAKVYLALLQLGPSAVLTVARRSGFKRPTVYLILEELAKKGVVTQEPGEKGRRYVAFPPQRLLERINRSAEIIRGGLPQLAALYHPTSSRPGVQLFEDREGIRSVYREITQNISRVPEVLSFYSVDSVAEDFEESFDLFYDMYHKHRARGREIICTASENHPYLQKVCKLPNFEARLTGPENKFFNDSILYGDKTALISFDQRFALTIESSDIAKSFRSLFELAWASAKIIG